jgi:hypothetical protein
VASTSVSTVVSIAASFMSILYGICDEYYLISIYLATNSGLARKLCPENLADMTTIQLKEFTKTGKLGTITIGSTKDEIVKVFGGKYDFADCGETQIIKYGWYEFFYWTESERVLGIQNDHLQADCINHSEMIDFKNRYCTIDKWFLKENTNVTFGQVVEYLNQENIPFDIVPAYTGCDEKVIKCIDSNVTFDFVDEYIQLDVNARGKVEKRKEVRVESQSDYVLNGIRLFEY